MKLLKSAAIVSSAALLMAVSASAQTLLLNGDFELPAGTPPMTFLSVGSTITGWTVVGPTGDNVNQVNAGANIWTGNNTQFMDLTGNTGGAGIMSDGFATTVGQAYEITFDAFNGSVVYPGTADTGALLSLQATGNAVTSYDGTTDLPAGVSENLSYDFTATASTTSLTFYDISGYDSNGGWIDNVSIQSVPEPGTSMLLLCAFSIPLGVKLLRMRSQKRAA